MHHCLSQTGMHMYIYTILIWKIKKSFANKTFHDLLWILILCDRYHGCMLSRIGCLYPCKCLLQRIVTKGVYTHANDCFNESLQLRMQYALQIWYKTGDYELKAMIYPAIDNHNKLTSISWSEIAFPKKDCGAYIVEQSHRFRWLLWLACRFAWRMARCRSVWLRSLISWNKFWISNRQQQDVGKIFTNFIALSRRKERRRFNLQCMLVCMIFEVYWVCNYMHVYQASDFTLKWLIKKYCICTLWWWP